jgi:hypothetical protein
VPVCASTGCSGWLWRCGRCPVASFGWIIIKAAASGDELLDSDTVFGVKDSLVKDSSRSRRVPPLRMDASVRFGMVEGAFRHRVGAAKRLRSLVRLGIRPARRSSRRRR